MRIVLDVSAVAKWFLREEESEEMAALRDLIVSGRIRALAPEIFLVELANVLRLASGVFPGDVAAALEAVEAVGVELRGSRDILERAVPMAFERGLTVYDALYAALAEAEGAKLVTYDRELLAKLECAVTAGSFIRGGLDPQPGSS